MSAQQETLFVYTTLPGLLSCTVACMMSSCDMKSCSIHKQYQEPASFRTQIVSCIAIICFQSKYYHGYAYVICMCKQSYPDPADDSPRDLTCRSSEPASCRHSRPAYVRLWRNILASGLTAAVQLKILCDHTVCTSGV